MDKKKFRVAVGRFFGWAGINFVCAVIKFLPYRFLYSFAKGLATMAYFLAVRQRRIALESLSIAFGQSRPPEELKRIARDCFILMAKSGVELLFLMDRPELLKERVRITGRQHLEEALKKNKGVILVSAHFGNFPLLMAKMGLEGYNISGIMRPMRDSRVEKFFLEKRNRVKVRTIYSQPRSVCVNETIACLRGNGLIFIPLDQNFGTAGVFVDFFGQKAATATGPIVLAQRTKAAILPCFIVRQRDDRHEIIIEKEQQIEGGSGNRQAMAANIQRLTGIIEDYIRRYPAQWGWVHRRWKSRPGKNEEVK